MNTGTTYTACGVNKTVERPVCPQTHIVDDTQPHPPFFLLAVIFGVRCTVNDTECLLLWFSRWTVGWPCLIKQKLQNFVLKICNWTLLPWDGTLFTRASDVSLVSYPIKQQEWICYPSVTSCRLCISVSSSGVLRPCEDAVAGWGGQGVLREIQRVPANRLCTIVSNHLPVQLHSDMISPLRYQY